MDTNYLKGGRPPGRRKTAKIEIVLEPHIKESFMNLMRIEGKCASVEIGNWVKEYVKQHPYTEFSDNQNIPRLK